MSSTFIRRLSSATTSSSATSADDSDCEHQFMVPMRHYGSKTSSIVHEGHFHCPTVEEVNNQIESFERRRLEFNQLQVTNPIEWDRKKSILSLAARLKKMSITMAESLAFRTTPPTTTVSWLGIETDAQNYELCYQSNGLSVWKKDFGNDRVIVRGEFLIPVSPKQYCQYASDISRRREWDGNVNEVRRVEEIAKGIDIAYVSINRIATVYPRDYINIRVINELKTFGRPTTDGHRHEYMHGPVSHGRWNESRGNRDREDDSLNYNNVDGQKQNGINHEKLNMKSDLQKKIRSSDFLSQIHTTRYGCYSSCSCSVEHPDVPEVPGKVRADVKVACYLAQPLFLPNKPIQRQTRNEMDEAIKKTETNLQDAMDSKYQYDRNKTKIWSRIYMFSEVDPKGWLPTTMSKLLAARVLPGTIERIVSCMLDHYHVPWRCELLYDPESEELRTCNSALEYCYFKYLYSIRNDDESKN